MSLYFTQDKYRELCEAAVDSQYALFTVGAYLTAQNLPRKCIVLRHDIDVMPGDAVRMAEMERGMGIKATYYFRFNKTVFQPHLIREIASMGHEIGYHYETLDKANGDYAKAMQIFKHELAEFRKIAEIKTICMHGNSLTKWDNRDLWTKYDFGDLGIIGEAYLSFDSGNITYLSDTGRTWGAERKVKDRLPSLTSDSKGGREAVVTSTDDIIGLLKSGELERVYILVHPARWSGIFLNWMIVLLQDIMINLVKGMLRLRGKGKILGS